MLTVALILYLLGGVQTYVLLAEWDNSISAREWVVVFAWPVVTLLFILMQLWPEKDD